VSRVESALNKVPGVRHARVNLATNQAAVEVAQPVEPEKLIDAVRRAGYAATPAGAPEEAGAELAERAQRELRSWRWRLVVGVLLLVPVVALHYAAPHLAAAHWIQLACATVLQFVVGWPFYVGALRRAQYLSTNMDTLVTIGTLAAYGAGAYSLIVAGSHATTGQEM
jgi:Cu+-exporting ATPase